MKTNNAETIPENALPFYGKQALVVGGTGGIGKALAIMLAEKGANVTVHGGSSEERLSHTLALINKIGNKIGSEIGQKIKGTGFLLQLGGEKKASVAAAEILATNLAIAVPPDILVCAWGAFQRSTMEETSSDLWQSMAESNLILPGALVSLALPAMLKKGWGRILLFGGTNTDTIRGFTTTAAYSSAKTALGVVAKSVAKRYAGAGITCNVICPGLTDTEYSTGELLSYNREKSPVAKPLVPKDIARVALSVLENPNLNGAIIPVDNGLVLGA
jgi:NAD(P)-dependent dehydrogenase (short-subunit alcohol dehydrogenase family)